jgi:hypothetical protein
MKPICECHNESSLLHNFHLGCANGLAKEKKKKEKTNMGDWCLHRVPSYDDRL